MRCNGPDETDCISCNNDNGFYIKEDDDNIKCYSTSDIGDGYYLDSNSKMFKKCYMRCSSCNQGGSETQNNCIKCLNDEYHFDPIKPNQCIKYEELPETNYYADINDDKYKLCHENCLKCSGPYESDCTLCNYTKGLFLKEGEIIKTCHLENDVENGYFLDSDNHLIAKCNQACLTCYGPGNDKCFLCNNNDGYFHKENNESQICYSNDDIDLGYYLDSIDSLFKRCNERCLTCVEPGSENDTKCTKCNNSLDYHFDPIKPNHCLKYDELIDINYYLDIVDDKFKLCDEKCSTCKDPNKCNTCNNTKEYYFIENDLSGICYNSISISVGYYLNLSDKLFKSCNNRCYSCEVGGSDIQSNCTKCKNSNNYHFHPFNLNHCIKWEELPNESFYLETSLDKYQICHESCLTCNGPSKYNCTSCNGQNYFKAEFFENQCLKLEEIPVNYYGVYASHKFTYYKCHISCRTCLTGGINNCQTCNIPGGYYPVIDKPGICLTEYQVPVKYYLDRNNSIINKCHPNCATCSKGYDNITEEMNCDSCINNIYFQNSSSTNCIPKPETRFYIDLYNGQETLFPCFPSCLTCNTSGDSDNNHCLSCLNEYYFDDEEPTNCVDDDLNCAIGCAKCYKNTTDPIYGVLSADKMCRRCSHKMGYYPLEKYSHDQFYVSCYPYNKSPFNYIYDPSKKLHTLCYRTCKTCYKVGDNLNHSCSSCETNYIFIDEEPFNCFPKCEHYYYYNKYKQYKCTETKQCPLEYPFLIANKSKCVDNCYSDDEFNLMFKNECFETCPEGTTAYLYRYNGEFTAKCVNSEEFLDDRECELNVKLSKLKYQEITNKTLTEYAEEYIHDYPVANNYVTSYLSPEFDTLNKYLIVLYKLEKCPKQKVEGFIPIGLDECIDKVKTKFLIMHNVVVEIFYIIRKNTPPQIYYYLYHPDTGEKLDLSICSGAKLAIKTSIFDNGNVNEELVRYFSNLNVNIFDIKDPFFTDICFNFDQDGKDIPLDDRIRLFYQNISLCEDGCSYVGINLETYEVECSCELKSEAHDSKSEDNIKNLLDNPLSNEVFGVLTNSNIEVLKCIKQAFDKKQVFKNYGGLMMVSLIIIQIVCAIFVKIGVRKVDRFIYTFVNNLKNPPKRKGNSIKFHPKSQENKNNKEKNNNDNDIISKASKDIIINDITPKDNKEKNEKINMNNNKGIKDLKLNSIINKVNKINDNYISRNDNYKFLKQSSLISTSSLLKTKDKYTLVKKGSIPYSTQCSNIISKDKSNSPNTSGSELNIFNINNSNNSNSSSGSDGEEKDTRINSGTGDHALYKVEEFNINNEKYENK